MQLHDQYVQDEYNIPFDVNLLKSGFDLNDFIGLLSDKCAAFFIESERECNYKIIFNTYNFMIIYDKMTLNDKFKFHLEQKRREFYARPENMDKIMEMKPIFMLIYMYAENGYKIGVSFLSGKIEFGAYASPVFYENLIDTLNKSQK